MREIGVEGNRGQTPISPKTPHPATLTAIPPSSDSSRMSAD